MLMAYSDYEQFNDYIDEINQPIEILGMKYSPSKVLYETDPIAYQVILSEYESEIDDKYAFGE
jgi:hypothetical protein